MRVTVASTVVTTTTTTTTIFVVVIVRGSCSIIEGAALQLQRIYQSRTWKGGVLARR